jgi:GH25 family lysozyme M1 (1,4-beta-N-acetylmuramidase)
MLKGIDVSKYQGIIDWNLVKISCDFVIIRAGYGPGTIDTHFLQNQSESRKTALLIGYYFFVYPERSSGENQATNFFNIVGELREREFIALDYEEDPKYGVPLKATDIVWVHNFLKTASILFGVKPLLYLNCSLKSRFNWQYIVADKYPLWIAYYGKNSNKDDLPTIETPKPNPWPHFLIWQFSSVGSVAGIKGNVDRDVIFGEIEDFVLKCGKPKRIVVSSNYEIDKGLVGMGRDVLFLLLNRTYRENSIRNVFFFFFLKFFFS